MASARFLVDLDQRRRTQLSVGIGSIASILACRRHVRLAGNLGNAGCPVLPVGCSGLDVIQAPKPEPRIMRYELTDFEWATIRSFLPNEPRGIPRVDDRRVLNGVFLALAPYLYGAQLDRTVLQQDQAMSACCDPIRQSSRPTIWLSSNSHQFEFGCVLPGPRLRNGRGFEVVEALFAPCAPSRHHETYWWARPRFSQRAPNCFASRASAISIQECDKTTRRANQSKVCPALRAKIFRLTRRANQWH
jgi:hypothetical protein